MADHYDPRNFPEPPAIPWGPIDERIARDEAALFSDVESPAERAFLDAAVGPATQREVGADDEEDAEPEITSLDRLRTLEGIPFEELDATEIPPPKWMVPGFLEEQVFAVLFGPPNSGKTFFAYEMAVQAAKAGFKVRIYQAEGSAFHLQKRLRRAVAAVLGVPKGSIVASWNCPIDLGDEEHIAQLNAKIKGYDLCIVDSMAAFSGGVSENEEEWGQISNNLAWLRIRSRCAVLAIHHSVKASWGPGDKPSLASLRGSGTLAGRADVAIACVPGREEDGFLNFELHDLKERDAGKSKPRDCTVAMNGPAAIFSFKDVEGVEERKAMAMDNLMLDVLAFVRDAGEEGCSINQVCKSVKGKDSRIRDALQTLHASGEIEKHATGAFERFRVSTGFGPPKGLNRAEPGRPD